MWNLSRVDVKIGLLCVTDVAVCVISQLTSLADI